MNIKQAHQSAAGFNTVSAKKPTGDTEDETLCCSQTSIDFSKSVIKNQTTSKKEPVKTFRYDNINKKNQNNPYLQQSEVVYNGRETQESSDRNTTTAVVQQQPYFQERSIQSVQQQNIRNKSQSQYTNQNEKKQPFIHKPQPVQRQSEMFKNNIVSPSSRNNQTPHHQTNQWSISFPKFDNKPQGRFSEQNQKHYDPATFNQNSAASSQIQQLPEFVFSPDKSQFPDHSQVPIINNDREDSVEEMIETHQSQHELMDENIEDSQQLDEEEECDELDYYQEEEYKEEQYQDHVTLTDHTQQIKDISHIEPISLHENQSHYIHQDFEQDPITEREDEPQFEQFVVGMVEDKSPNQRTNALSFSPINVYEPSSCRDGSRFNQTGRTGGKFHQREESATNQYMSNACGSSSFNVNVELVSQNTQLNKHCSQYTNGTAGMHNRVKSFTKTPHKSNTKNRQKEQYFEINSDTKDYSPIYDRKHTGQATNIGRVEHSEIKLHQNVSQLCSMLEADTSQISSSFVNQENNASSVVFYNQEQPSMNIFDQDKIAITLLDRNQQPQVLHQNKMTLMTFSQNDQSMRQINKNVDQSNINIQTEPSQHLDQQEDQRIQTTFQSMCSELPHSTQKMFLTIENQLRESQPQIYYQQVQQQQQMIQQMVPQLQQIPPEQQVQQQHQQQLENSYVIYQYEMVLQRIGSQFQECLQRNQMLEGYVKQLQSETMKVESQNQFLDTQLKSVSTDRDKLRQALEEQEYLFKRLKTEYEQVKSEKLCIQQQLDQKQNTLTLLNKNEDDLRKKIDQLYLKINDQEKVIREKDEGLFNFNSERLNLICDIKNLKQTEEIVKSENDQLNQKRRELEIAITELKTQLYQYENHIRQLESENNSMKQMYQQYVMNLRNNIMNQEASSQHNNQQLNNSYNTQQITPYQNEQSQTTFKKPSFTVEQQRSPNSNKQEIVWPAPKQQQQQQQQQSPARQQPPEIASIPWLSNHKTQLLTPNEPSKKCTDLRTSKQDWPSTQQTQNKENYQMFKARNNQSQLSNVFFWGGSDATNTTTSSQPTQRDPSLKNTQRAVPVVVDPKHSLERPKNNSLNTSLTYHQQTHKQQSNSYQALNNSYQANVSSQQNQSYYNQQPQSQRLKNQKELLQENTKQTVTFPSNQQYLDSKDIIQKLEQQLVSLQSEKQRMEVEYSKIPSSNINSLALKNKKEDLEFELELNQKNINLVKQKLRDHKAL